MRHGSLSYSYPQATATRDYCDDDEHVVRCKLSLMEQKDKSTVGDADFDEDCDEHLVFAALLGEYSRVKELMEKGANMNVSTREDRETALHKACSAGHGNIVKLLLENNAKVNVRNKDGATPLHLACMEGHLKIIQLLIDHGVADIVNSKDNLGWTPLREACEGEHFEIGKLLVANGADLESKNHDTVYGRSLLHWACWNGNLKMCTFLVENSADIHSKDNFGKTAIKMTISINSCLSKIVFNC